MTGRVRAGGVPRCRAVPDQRRARPDPLLPAGPPARSAARPAWAGIRRYGLIIASGSSTGWPEATLRTAEGREALRMFFSM